MTPERLAELRTKADADSIRIFEALELIAEIGRLMAEVAEFHEANRKILCEQAATKTRLAETEKVAVGWRERAMANDAEVARLQGIVARTADGVEIVAGMEVWTPHTLGPSRDIVQAVGVSVRLVEPSHWAEGDADADRLYSTREAAEATAKEPKP